MSESLEPATVEKLLDDLFPSGEVHNPEEIWNRIEVVLNPEDYVTPDEIKDAIRGRRRGGCPAPGSDGLSLTIWKCVPAGVVEALTSLYTLCLNSLLLKKGLSCPDT